jgi:hypothetical protein
MPDQSNPLPGPTPGTAASIEPAVGARVIAWDEPDPVQYAGPSGGPWTELTIAEDGTGTPSLRCDPRSVAPAGVLIPRTDPRVVVERRPRGEVPAGSGPWRLSLPDQPPSWHATKREATVAGLRRLAILDWHAGAAVLLPHTRMRVPHTRLTLRKLRTMPTSDGEAYTAELVLDGSPVGTIENTGVGGATTWFPHDRQVFGWAQMEAFVAACRDEHGEPMAEEFVLAELFEETHTARDVARLVRAGRTPVRTFAAITSGEQVVDTYPDAYFGLAGDWAGRLEQVAALMWREVPGAHAIEVWTGAAWAALLAPQAFRLRLPTTGYVVLSSSQRDGEQPLAAETFIDAAGRMDDAAAIAYVRAELAELAAYAPSNVLHTWRLVHRSDDGEREVLAPPPVRGRGAPLNDEHP